MLIGVQRARLDRPEIAMAAKAEFDELTAREIIQHMNTDHSDAVVLYAEAFGSTDQQNIQTAVMTKIDSRGIELVCIDLEASFDLRIDFKDTTVGSESIEPFQARAVLIRMAKIARARTERARTKDQK